jgi:hypothetical protein
VTNSGRRGPSPPYGHPSGRTYTREGGGGALTVAEYWPVLKLLLLVAAVGVLLVAGSGRLDDFRSEVTSLRANWFDAITNPSSQADKRKKEWDALAAEANSICTDHEQDELVLRLALPRNRADYLRALGIALDRERTKLAALRALQPPSYDVSYSKFLHDRQDVLSALERLRLAVRAKDRKNVISAARAVLRIEATINGYVQSAGMPACII